MFSILKAELKKYLLDVRTYYPDHLTDLITTYIFFVGFSFFSKTSHTIEIGLLVWFFSHIAIDESSAAISLEKSIGTLEQLMLKPCNLLSIIFCRSFCWFLVSFVEIIALLGSIKLLTSISIEFSFPTVWIILITLIGLYGFGFLLAALTICITKTASFGGLLKYFLLFFTGAVIDINQLPPVLKTIANLLPLTQGIALCKKIIATNLNLLSILQIKDFYYLLISSFLYLVIGTAFFQYAILYSRKNALFKQY